MRHQVNIENGRVIDRTETGVMLKSALRAIVDKYRLTMVCTPNQSVLFKDIAPEQREGVEAILTSYGVKPIEQVTTIILLRYGFDPRWPRSLDASMPRSVI